MKQTCFFSISDFLGGVGAAGGAEAGPRSNACFHSLTRNPLDGLTKYPVRQDIKKGQEIITYFLAKRLAQVKHGSISGVGWGVSASKLFKTNFSLQVGRRAQPCDACQRAS